MNSFIAGNNSPGYLPDSEPVSFDSWEDAKQHQINELLWDADHTENKTVAEALDSMAQELSLTSGPEWYRIILGREFWIRHD